MKSVKCRGCPDGPYYDEADEGGILSDIDSGGIQ